MMFKVYKITCLDTGRFYIGVTGMKLEYRISSHRSNSRSIAHELVKSCEVRVIARYFSKEDAELREDHEIKSNLANDLLINIRHSGYTNPLLGAGGRKRKGNTNSRRTPVEAIDDQGNVVYTFDTVMGAATALSTHRNMIHRAMCKPNHKAAGLFWRKQE